MITMIKQKLQQILPKNTFVRGVSVLIYGTAGAQVLQILAAPFLTRLYGPGDFGLLAVYTGILALISMISSLRYELSIPLIKDNGEAASVVVLSLVLVFVSSIATGVMLLLIGPELSDVLGVPALSSYLWLIPLGVLFSGFYNTFYYCGLRSQQFSAVTKSKLLQAVGALVIQIAGYKFGGISLLAAQATGQSLGTVNLFRATTSSLDMSAVGWESIRSGAIRYKRFPMYSTWSGLINVAGHQFPLMMFSALFNAGVAGTFLLVHRVLMGPLALISNSIGSVFLSQAPVSKENGDLSRLYGAVQDKLIQLGLPPAIIIVVGGPSIFELIFGEEWRIAGEYSQWLAIGFFASFVVSPLSGIFLVLEKQITGLVLQAVLFSTRLAGLSIGVLYSDPHLSVVMYSLSSIFGYFIYIVFMSKFVEFPLLYFSSSLFRSAVVSLVASVPIWIAISYNDTSLLYVGIAMSSVVVCFRYWFVLNQKFEGVYLE